MLIKILLRVCSQSSFKKQDAVVQIYSASLASVMSSTVFFIDVITW